MRIAIVTAWYPSKRNPLYGIFIENQVKALSEHCELVVLLLTWSLIPYEKTRKEGKVTIIEKGDFYFPNATEQFLNFWASRYVRFFKKIHKKYSFDLVHCHDHYGAFVGDKIKRSLYLPYISTIHNSNILNDTLVKWKKSYLNRVLNNANKVIAVSSSLAQALRSNYGVDDIEVISNYIDTQRFDRKPAKPSDEFRYLFVGGLESHKGIKLLVESFCKAQLPNSALHIVGEGYLKEELIEFVKKQGMENRIVFYGRVANEDLPIIYNSCHVYVSVSEYETFGVSVLEAMSCGLPVLYSSSGGPDEIIDENSGLLISDRALDTIAEGLLTIKTRYLTFDGERIRNHVIQNFGSKQVVQKLLKVYKKVLDA